VEAINKLCFTQLAAIWWSWYVCNLVEFSTVNDACPVQDKRVPASTTFLFTDNQQNCTDFKLNERFCNIPADNWIVLPIAASSVLTDFVSTNLSIPFENAFDTPEGLMMLTNGLTNLYNNVTAKFNGTDIVDIELLRYESQDLCSLEIVDTEGCVFTDFANGWSIYSNGYWLRIPPQGMGTYTIEVFNELDGACSGTKYSITGV
jgi:hypothetical protein